MFVVIGGSEGKAFAQGLAPHEAMHSRICGLSKTITAKGVFSLISALRKSDAHMWNRSLEVEYFVLQITICL